MYTGCCRNNHIHPYKLFWVGVAPYRLTLVDLNMLYKWSVEDLWAEEISRILFRFVFSCLYNGGQGCAHIW
jgi:hypothetical protein